MSNEPNNIENPETTNPMAADPMMPPQAPMMPPPPQGWRGRWLRRLGGGQVTSSRTLFPRWIARDAILTYLFALAIVSIMYSAFHLPWYYLLFGVVSVLAFFLCAYRMAKGTFSTRKRNFEKRIFWVSFVPRVVFTLVLYEVFQVYYGDAFGFENADPTYYHDLGIYVSNMIAKGDFHFYDNISQWSGNKDIADMGYGVYLGFIYWLAGQSILIARLLKCMWSSLTVVLLYRLAKRNFGSQAARLAAVFCALWPNFWYYCTTHLKETEMVFLTVLFIEQADQMLRSRKFTAWKVIPVLLIAALIFTFRTPLGIIAILALVFSIVMSSSKVVTWGKRFIVGGLAIALIITVAGNQIEEKAHGLVEQVQTDQQKNNMEWRSQRKDGNAFAKYAGAAVFAPMILTIPFPSMAVPYEGQELPQLLNGGNFIKNALSFFTIFAFFILVLTGEWREHLLPFSFVVGYLIVLVLSTFAQSERFHQPVMPFEFMFAVYGCSLIVGNRKFKRWFIYWCVLLFVATIIWNWFKLAGRGLA